MASILEGWNWVAKVRYCVYFREKKRKNRKIFSKKFGGLKKVVFLQPQTKGH